MLINQGTIIDGRYEVRAAIGSGGMGVVYEAYQHATDRVVALKLLTYAPSAAPDEFKRFEREAIVLSRLSHSNIIRFLGYGFWEGYPYIVMERLFGCSLQKKLAEAPDGIDAQIALKIGIEICSALEHAHNEGIFHRDIKPSNIICEQRDETVKLIDFGLAKLTGIEGHQKLTQTGMALGSVMYMSPEQCLARPVDGRSDVYGLGCLLFECFTGQPPFSAENGVAMMFQHLNEPITNAERWSALTEPQQHVIRKCLAKQPKHRYASAHELSLDLQQLLAGSAPTSVPLKPHDDLEYSAEMTQDLGKFRQFLQASGQQTRPGRQISMSPKSIAISGVVILSLGIAIIVATTHFLAGTELLQSDTSSHTETTTLAGASDEQLVTSPKVAMFRADSVRARDRNTKEYLLWLNRANQLADAQPSTDPHVTFQIKQRLTEALDRVSDKDKAHAMAVETLNLSKSLSKAEQAVAYRAIAAVLIHNEKPQEALPFALKSVELYKQVAQESKVFGKSPSAVEEALCAALENLAACYNDLHDYKRSDAALEEAIARFIPLKENALRELVLIRTRGSRAKDAGDLSRSKEIIDQWLEREQSLDLANPEMFCERAYGHEMIALLLRAKGELAGAEKHQQEAVDLILRASAGADVEADRLHYLSIISYELNKIDAGDKAADAARARWAAKTNTDKKSSVEHQKRARATALARLSKGSPTSQD